MANRSRVPKTLPGSGNKTSLLGEYSGNFCHPFPVHPSHSSPSCSQYFNAPDGGIGMYKPGTSITCIQQYGPNYNPTTNTHTIVLQNHPIRPKPSPFNACTIMQHITPQVVGLYPPCHTMGQNSPFQRLSAPQQIPLTLSLPQICPAPAPPPATELRAPVKLYHYTTPEGAEGILRDKGLKHNQAWVPKYGPGIYFTELPPTSRTDAIVFNNYGTAVTSGNILKTSACFEFLFKELPNPVPHIELTDHASSTEHRKRRFVWKVCLSYLPLPERGTMHFRVMEESLGVPKSVVKYPWKF